VARSLVVTAVLLMTARAAISADAIQDPECTAHMSPGLQEIDWTQPGRLAGTYDVVLVDSVAPRNMSIYRRFRLVLSLPDSAVRTFPPVSLVAAVETAETREQSVAWQQPWPRSGLTGHTLVIGMLGVLDGIGEALYPLRLSPNGFRGSWIHSSGLATVVVGDDGTVYPPPPEPQGYFCAVRVN
jgi:hypothetical protein